MQTKKKRLTLDMAPAFQRRLKATAALKGVSMRQYCLTAIEGELDKDEVDSGDVESESVSAVKDKPVGFDIDGLRALRKELFGDRVFPGNSADLLREARRVRDVQLAGDDDDDDDRPLSERFREVRKKVFGDRVLPGNSADLIREAREIRTRQMEDW